MRRALPWVLVALAALLLLSPIDPALVERWYSGRVYLQVQPFVTSISNAVPFAAFDVILVSSLAVAVWVIAAAIRALRRGDRWRALARAVVRMLIVGAVLYLWFLAVWGLNYRRVPLLERLELAHGPPSSATVLALGRQAVDR